VPAAELCAIIVAPAKARVHTQHWLNPDNNLGPLSHSAVRGSEMGVCLDRNQLKFVMRGPDPRIHSRRRPQRPLLGVDGRIKSGHDNCELRKGHCAFGSAAPPNSAGSAALSREWREGLLLP